VNTERLAERRACIEITRRWGLPRRGAWWRRLGCEEKVLARRRGCASTSAPPPRCAARRTRVQL